MMEVTDKYRRNWITIMISLSLLVIVMTVAVQASMYSYFVKIYTNVLCEVESDVLEQKSNNLLYLTENIQSLSNEVRLNDIIMQLCYRQDLDAMELIRAQNQLDTVRISSNIVQSIYMINKKTEEVHVTMDKSNRLYSFEDFYDQDIFTYMGNISSYGTYTPVTRNLSLPNGKTVPVLTYYLYDYFMESQIMDGIVLINVPIEWLEKKINAKEEGYYQDGNDLIVVDGNGQVVFSTGGLPFGENLKDKNYVEQVLASDEDKGNFVQSIDGNRYLISYYKYSNTGWNMIGVKSYSSIEEQLIPIRLFTVLAGLFVFGGGMVVVWFLSRRMAQVYQRMSVKMEKLQEENQSHVIARKNDFIRALLKGTAEMEPQKLEEAYQKYSLHTEPLEAYFVVLFEVDRFKAFCKAYNIDERTRIMKEAEELIRTGFGSYYAADVAVLSENQIVVLCNVKEVPEIIQISGTVLEIVQRLNRQFQEKWMIEFSCALSSVGDSSRELTGLYEEVLTSIQYRYMMGYKSFLFPDMLPDKTIASDSVGLKQAIGEVVSAVGKGKLKNAEQLLDNCLESMGNISPYEIKIMLINMVIQISNMVPEMEVPSDVELFSLENMINDVLNTETLEETKRVVTAICEETSRLVEEHKKGKHDQLIREVKEYITAHISEENLSINLLADNAGLSVGYLGRVFKKKEGISIAEYIMQVRLERVESMLRDGEVSINSIARQVGFLNNSYFYYVFKKKYNMTPNQWRTMELGKEKK